MGGIISTTIKSGTNQFHGSVFDFFRNDKLNANEWANNFNAAPSNARDCYNFGGTFGGPIKKDKLFFFVDYQGQLGRYYNQPQLHFAPDTAGTRRQLFAASQYSFDRQERVSALESVCMAVRRAPFAGNIIPANPLSPAAVKIVTSQYYPAASDSNLHQQLPVWGTKCHQR